ncbi:hypothetical protein PV326_012895 [Microctonus aethiopoides]|nr:hypothetical protein PV326_012895 [Microctonus aethiopoides]
MPLHWFRTGDWVKTHIAKKSNILSRLSTVQIVFNSSMLTCAMSICESRLVNAAYSTAASGHRCRRGIWMAPPLLADMVLVIHSLQALKEQDDNDPPYDVVFLLILYIELYRRSAIVRIGIIITSTYSSLAMGRTGVMSCRVRLPEGGTILGLMRSHDGTQQSSPVSLSVSSVLLFNYPFRACNFLRWPKIGYIRVTWENLLGRIPIQTEQFGYVDIGTSTARNIIND